jgi:quinohemoprotein ethanol dehydrogenase
VTRIAPAWLISPSGVLALCLSLSCAAGPAGQWPATGGDWTEAHYSPLARIDTTNVSQLGVAWEYDATPSRGRVLRGLEATPLMVDGVLYFSLPWSEVVALDARSGRQLWRYDPKADGAADRSACCDVVNRGVALHDGRVYVGTIDGFLVALDATSGRELWRVDTLVDRSRDYTITGAPQVAGDLVVIGNGGADLGVRGYVTAYDRTTGTQRWRFWTVPGDPAKGFEHPELEMAAKTWDPKSHWESGGGGTAWDSMAYDPKLGLLYVGTGNGSPYPSWIRSPAGGDNLFVSSILAIDAATGRLRWHYQTTPGENWDYTSTQPLVLADLEIDGRLRHVLMQAPKNGFFYVLDRGTGELISARNFVHVNWASGIDAKTGRPLVTADGWYKDTPKLIFPSQAGAHNWMPMSFHPGEGLVYIPAIDTPMLFSSAPAYDYAPGRFNMGGGGALPPIPPEYARGAPHTDIREYLLAWDPRAQREVWRVSLPGFWNGGVLSTAGGLVFQGNSAGHFVAYDASSGKVLKDIETGTGIMAGAATYELNGEQYVVVLAGYGGAMLKMFLPGTAAQVYRNDPRVIAFKLGGGPARLPAKLAALPLPEKPYVVDATPARLAAGRNLYLANCARCHGGFFEDLPSGYPDLKRMPSAVHDIFREIVLDGALRYNGMASFADVLSSDDVAAIQNWLKSETNALISRRSP